MTRKISVMVMSGVEDGAQYVFDADNGDGLAAEGHWTLSIGRRDENDICLRNDTYVSRHHANLHFKDNRWWLEDRKSTNGTFTENPDNFFEDTTVTGIVPVKPGQLFRIGRTWLRIQLDE